MNLVLKVLHNLKASGGHIYTQITKKNLEKSSVVFVKLLRRSFGNLKIVFRAKKRQIQF